MDGASLVINSTIQVFSSKNRISICLGKTSSCPPIRNHFLVMQSGRFPMAMGQPMTAQLEQGSLGWPVEGQ